MCFPNVQSNVRKQSRQLSQQKDIHSQMPCSTQEIKKAHIDHSGSCYLALTHELTKRPANNIRVSSEISQQYYDTEWKQELQQRFLSTSIKTKKPGCFKQKLVNNTDAPGFQHFLLHNCSTADLTQELGFVRSGEQNLMNVCVNAFDLSNMKRMRDKVSPTMRGSSTGTLCKPNRGSSVCMDAGLQMLS